MLIFLLYLFYVGDTCCHSIVCPSVCVSSVTLVHPAKAVGWNEMPVGRKTRPVPDNIVLHSVYRSLVGRADLGVGMHICGSVDFYASASVVCPEAWCFQALHASVCESVRVSQTLLRKYLGKCWRYFHTKLSALLLFGTWIYASSFEVKISKSKVTVGSSILENAHIMALLTWYLRNYWSEVNTLVFGIKRSKVKVTAWARAQQVKVYRAYCCTSSFDLIVSTVSDVTCCPLASINTTFPHVS